MPNRKSENTSGIPGGPKLPEEKQASLRRQEGTVNEHRERLNRNHQHSERDEEKESRRHREPGRRRQ